MNGAKPKEPHDTESVNVGEKALKPYGRSRANFKG